MENVTKPFHQQKAKAPVSHPSWFLLILGFLSFAGLAGYAAIYLINMPVVSPGSFIPQSLGSEPAQKSFPVNLQAFFVLMFAFAFMPVQILFTIRHFRKAPVILTTAASLMLVSLLIEIFNNFPMLVGFKLPPANVPDELKLYLLQKEATRYLAMDVAGFTFIYISAFLTALVFFRTDRLLSYSVFGSIALFIANVPCLWISPVLAVVLMSLSVLCFGLVPIKMAWMANPHQASIKTS